MTAKNVAGNLMRELFLYSINASFLFSFLGTCYNEKHSYKIAASSQVFKCYIYESHADIQHFLPV